MPVGHVCRPQSVGRHRRAVHRPAGSLSPLSASRQAYRTALAGRDVVFVPYSGSTPSGTTPTSRSLDVGQALTGAAMTPERTNHTRGRSAQEKARGRAPASEQYALRHPNSPAPSSLDGIRQDVRYALRAMRKKPAFTALAVGTLALGIGVNTASVAVAYGILVRPLPYHDPSRVVVLNLLFPDGGDLGFSPAALQAWLPRLRTVESAAGYYRREVTLRSGDRTTLCRRHSSPTSFSRCWDARRIGPRGVEPRDLRDSRRAAPYRLARVRRRKWIGGTR